MLRRRRTKSGGREEGFALAVVMLGGMVLVLITVVVASRAARQAGTVSGDVRWEQALHVAESCLDVGLVQLNDDQDWTTGEIMPDGTAGSSSEKPWAVSSADARALGEVVATPEGECFMVKPSNAELLYAVGFVPSRAGSERRVRVVRAALSAGASAFQVTYAFLTNDDFEINGNPTWHGASASAHTNGAVSVPGNPTFHDGCLTAVNGGTITGNLNVHSSCPIDPYYQDEVVIPEIVPRDLWNLSEYDLCPNGAVRAGPAHPTLGGTAGLIPCTGQVLEDDASDGYRGWEFEGCCDDVHGAEWDYDDKKANHGAYYIFEGSGLVSGKAGSKKKPWNVLIIAEPSGSCSDHTGGDVELSGNMAMGPYTAGSVHADNTFVVVAGRDVDWNGNGKLLAPGIVAAVEQIDINGNVDVTGGFVSEGECDSINDEIDETSINGNPTFRLDGPLETTWESGSGEFGVVGWDEL